MYPKVLSGPVKELLRMFSDSLSCNGCNDFDLSEEQLQAAREYLNDPDAGEQDYTVLAVIRKALGVS